MLDRLSKVEHSIHKLTKMYNSSLFDEVLDTAYDLVRIYPKNVEIHKILGGTHFALGNTNEALKHFEETIILEPNCPISLNNLAIVLNSIGEYDLAITSLLSAIDINPNYCQGFKNLGNAYFQKKLFRKAVKNFEQSININPHNAGAYNNLGLSLHSSLQYEQAIINFRKAIAIEPHFVDSYFNLANTFHELGRYDEALNNFKHIIKIKPNFAKAYNNLGTILLSQGKIQYAINHFVKAIALDPEIFQAYYSLGNALRKKGQLWKALEQYEFSLKINPSFTEAIENFKSVMGEILSKGMEINGSNNFQNAMGVILDFLLCIPSRSETLLEKAKEIQAEMNKFEFKSKKTKNKTTITFLKNSLDWEITIDKISNLLEEKNSYNPVEVTRKLVKILHVDPVLQLFINKDNLMKIETNLASKLMMFSKNNLLLKMMNICPIPSIEIENLLTKIRLKILKSINKLARNNQILKFQSSLALQCYINEFIYHESPVESEEIKKLEYIIKKQLYNGKQPEEKLILCLASYRILRDYSWINLLISTENIEKIIKVHVNENKIENYEKSKIKNSSELANEVSRKVQTQYESNPYPRWIYMNVPLSPYTIHNFLEKKQLNPIDDKILETENPKILIAGCGTGRQAIAAATKYKNCTVFAIDLSLPSLAYAKRKTMDLNIRNITYIQADILELKDLKIKFDLIECTGVLHHMEDPITGWKTLYQCLNNGGLMRIGLYSKYARKHISEVRKSIGEKYQKTNQQDIRSFRKNLIKHCSQDHKKIFESTDDFYSTSTFRDLLLHVQEHQFTIPKIQKALKQLLLNFCGFELTQQIIEDFYSDGNHKVDLYNLAKWNLFEKKNPYTFAGMYLFWCQKI